MEDDDELEIIQKIIRNKKELRSLTQMYEECVRLGVESQEDSDLIIAYKEHIEYLKNQLKHRETEPETLQ